MSECICSAGGKEGDYLHSDYCPVGKDQRIAEMEAELAQSSDHIIEQERGIVGRENRIGELEAELDTFRDASLLLTGKLEDAQAELAAIKEKARAAVQYEDILDMGLAQALRELEEALPQETKDARPSYDERVDEWKEMHRSDGE